MIFVIKHTPSEGPGTIADFLKEKDLRFREVELYAGDHLPTKLSEVDAVISMGGPMNVYEEEQYPFLMEEDEFFKKVLKERVPFLGICLGSQLLAKASNAKVTKAPIKEIGWSKVQLTKEGQRDPFFAGLDQEFDVFQWHEDTFAIPREGQHLAKSQECLHQALKVGACAYGLQFHVEVTDDMITEWIEENFKDPQELAVQQREMLGQYAKIKNKFNKQANTIYNNFVNIIAKNKRKTSFAASVVKA